MSDDIGLAERAERWLATGLSCEPADRDAAAAAVREVYAAADLPPPRQIIWVDSPAAAAIAVAMLRTGLPGEPGDEDVYDRLVDQDAEPGQVELGRSVRAQVRTRPWAQARAAAVEQLGGVGYARAWAASSRRPWHQLVDLIAGPLRTHLDLGFSATGGTFGEAGREALLDAILGQHDGAWLGMFEDHPQVAELARVAESAGWWWAYENVAVISDRPREVHRDNLGRLHHGDGPALGYDDGFGLYAWRGMPIPADVAALLPSLTAERVRAETNAEMRRVMLEYFGYDRYLRESGAVKLQADEFGTLWRVDLPGDEPLMMVEVINATPEPDGSRRTYFLRVPPRTRSARAGVAWTFDLTEQEYVPQQQT